MDEEVGSIMNKGAGAGFRNGKIQIQGVPIRSASLVYRVTMAASNYSPYMYCCPVSVHHGQPVQKELLVTDSRSRVCVCVCVFSFGLFSRPRFPMFTAKASLP